MGYCWSVCVSGWDVIHRENRVDGHRSGPFRPNVIGGCIK
jgi:hypothetical protein